MPTSSTLPPPQFPPQTFPEASKGRLVKFLFLGPPQPIPFYERYKRRHWSPRSKIWPGRAKRKKKRKPKELERRCRQFSCPSSYVQSQSHSRSITGHFCLCQTLFHTWIDIFNCHCSPMKCYFYPYFTDEQTEAQRRHIPCSGRTDYQVARGRV